MKRFRNKARWKSSKGQIRYKTWRKNVFELNKIRYGMGRQYTCVKCGKVRKTTRVLHAHHIASWDKFESKRYDRNNGVVLCKWCHDGFHYKYKWDALKQPELLLEWVGSDKYVKQFIEENDTNGKK